MRAAFPLWNTYISIIASSIMVSILILWTFSDLVIMDIMVYGAACPGIYRLARSSHKRTWEAPAF